MTSIIMALIMGLLGGPAMAWAMALPKNQKAHEERRAKYAAGKGSDPDKAPFGPHKSFKHNAILFGLIMAAIGAFIGALA